jgi:uncharacterized protein
MGTTLARPHTIPACMGCTLAGVELLLHPAGVAFHMATRTLLVADLHLEKGTAYAARGQMLPPYETLETLRRLMRVVREFSPQRLVLLGDSFHSRHHALKENGEALRLISSFAKDAELVWIAGNHDPDLPLDLPGRCAPEITLEGITLRHAPAANGLPEIIGHLHPVASLATRAGRQRRKCFVLSSQRLLMPAFGALTGGVEVTDPMIARWFEEPEIRAFLLCRNQLQTVPVAALA